MGPAIVSGFTTVPNLSDFIKPASRCKEVHEASRDILATLQGSSLNGDNYLQHEQAFCEKRQCELKRLNLTTKELDILDRYMLIQLPELACEKWKREINSSSPQTLSQFWIIVKTCARPFTVPLALKANGVENRSSVN